MKTYTCQRCDNEFITTCTKPVKWCPDCRQVVQREQKAEWEREHADPNRHTRRSRGNPMITDRETKRAYERERYAKKKAERERMVAEMPKLTGEYQPNKLDILAAAIIGQAWRDCRQAKQDGEFVPIAERMDAPGWMAETGHGWLEVLAPDLELRP